jgi:hypothetical protein
MTASAITYFLAVCFWTLTATYGVLTSQAFIQQQFLAPRLFPPLVAFADWHTAIGLLLLGAWIGPRRRAFAAPREKRTWTTAIVWLGATVLQMVMAPLSEPQATIAAQLTIVGGLALVLLVALAELRMRPGAIEDIPRDRSRADLFACLLSATVVTIVYAAAAVWFDGVSATVGFDALQSLRLHLLLAAVAFLALASVRSMAALTSRPRAAEAVLCSAILAVAFATFLAISVLPAISIRGSLGLSLGLGFGVALACAIHARGTVARTDDGVLRSLASLSPKVVTRWWGFALWFACLLAFAVVAISASRTVDWNFVLLRSAITLTWLLALSAALTITRRFAAGGSITSFAIVALLLGAHTALQSAVAPVQASSLGHASGKWLAEMLEGTVQVKGGNDFVRFLHAHTNIPRDTQVDAVEVNLAALNGPPGSLRPHIFLFVVDSLRRDYLSPYNPAVTFTPGIGELARDSLVFTNAFTQYGATGLSIPSIWVGGSILHKQYVTSFPRMNSLAKLLAHEQYDQWIGADHIMNTILPRSGNRFPLDAGIPVKDFRMCRTLTEIQSRLAARPPASPPVFAYSLPQDVHISVLTREGAHAVDDRAYAGFYAPVASRVRRLDECLSQFVRDLKARGLYEQSVIIVTSDHGDSLGEEGRMGHAYSLHPEIVRVPLIIHLPPNLRQAWSWDESRPAYTTDITPTLYRLLGHEPTAPASFFGEPLARHPGAAPTPRRARIVAASYGAVYGALLDDATRYYVFDAISMRQSQFDLGDGAPREVPVTPDTQDEGMKAIRETLAAISTFYRFSTARDSVP